jgi:hypothetical protein
MTGRTVHSSFNVVHVPLYLEGCARLPGVCDFALDDFPEKWKHYAELNASYVQGGKFTSAEFAKHQAAK